MGRSALVKLFARAQKADAAVFSRRGGEHETCFKTSSKVLGVLPCAMRRALRWAGTASVPCSMLMDAGMLQANVTLYGCDSTYVDIHVCAADQVVMPLPHQARGPPAAGAGTADARSKNAGCGRRQGKEPGGNLQLPVQCKYRVEM